MGAATALASATCSRDWSYAGGGAADGSATGNSGGGGGQSPDSGSPGCDLGQTRCDAACVDLDNDAKHCGACERACALDGSCHAGVCQCFAGTVEPIDPRLPQDKVLGDGGGGPSLGCARAQAVSQPSIHVSLLAGQTMVLRVDGLGGASGGYKVNVDREPSRCTNVSLAGPLPLVVTGDTFGRGDTLSPSCGPQSGGGADIDYRYTAPANGGYEISVNTSSYDTILAIRAGDCEGEEIACNDDEPDPDRAAVTVNLVAGQVINIAVDSYDAGDHGEYTLTLRTR